MFYRTLAIEVCSFSNFVVVFFCLVVFPFPLAYSDFSFSRRCDPNPFLNLGMERWRLDIEKARETEMVREMYMKMVGDGDS